MFPKLSAFVLGTITLLAVTALGISRVSLSDPAPEQSIDSPVLGCIVTMPGHISAVIPGPGASVHNPEQTLQTDIGDPAHPLEPWTVTTYRKPGESVGALINRHRAMVDAVREALGA